jgi:hypothetical protein
MLYVLYIRSLSISDIVQRIFVTISQSHADSIGYVSRIYSLPTSLRWLVELVYSGAVSGDYLYSRGSTSLSTRLYIGGGWLSLY